MLAGPSKHFKSAFALLLAAAYLKKYDDAVILFYDSEFGTPQAYFDSFGIDMSRVIHTPITDVEELKFDIMKQLDSIEKKDKVVVVIDSIGNLASKKEVDDAMNEKSVADMSRAKQMKSLFRMITPHLNLKDIPLIAINHTYKEIALYPKDIVSGGTGAYYSASDIWIIGRQQEKDGTEVSGYHFVINIEKSRYVREKSKIPITVTFEGGISKWSGLMDVAEEGGYLRKPKVGWYQAVDPETGEVVDGAKNYREADTDTKEFWLPILKSPSFNKFVENKYCISHGALISAEDNTAEVYTDLDEDN
jgi:RecA/RadA recombinase